MRIVRSQDSADLVTVAGPDAAQFLQGQMSADVTLLGDLGNAWSFLLEPTGKCGYWGRLCATEVDRFVFVLPVGFAEAAAARLSRFLLRTDAEVTASRCALASFRWEGELVGVSSAVAGALLRDRHDASDWFAYDLTRSIHSVGIDVACLAVDSLADGFVDDVQSALSDLFTPLAVEHADSDELERIRIEALQPRMGAEIVDGTLPAATGMVNDSVSFAKGCYTGQELVARMDSRTAGSPEHLVLIRSVGSSGVPAPGSAVVVEGSTGRITSSAQAGTGWVALAYVPRLVAIDPGASLPATVDGATAVLVGP